MILGDPHSVYRMPGSNKGNKCASRVWLSPREARLSRGPLPSLGGSREQEMARSLGAVSPCAQQVRPAHFSKEARTDRSQVDTPKEAGSRENDSGHTDYEQEQVPWRGGWKEVDSTSQGRGGIIFSPFTLLG